MRLPSLASLPSLGRRQSLAGLRRTAVEDSDRGSVTVELVAALPVLVTLMLVGLSGVVVSTQHLRCVDAARDAALAGARGDDVGQAARRSLPGAEEVAVTRDGDLLRVVVRARIRPFGDRTPALIVEGTAVAAVEPGVAV